MGALCAVCAAGALAWTNCSVYDASLLVAGGADGGGDDAGSDSPPGDDAGCLFARPPPKPASDDGNGDTEFIVALHTLDFGATLDGGALGGRGYDLDSVCTCPGPESCKPWPGAKDHCDDDGGRDNSGGQL